MNHEDARLLLSKKLFAQRPDAVKYTAYVDGSNPLKWISAETADEVKNYGDLNLNYCSTVVEQIVQKLEVVGWLTSNNTNDEMTDLWERLDLAAKSEVVFTEALTIGRSYWLVWAGPDGGPNVTPESGTECAVLRDPLTGAVQAGLKRWIELDGTIRALLFTPEDVTEYVAKGNPLSDPVVDVPWLSGISDDMTIVSRQPNPFARVPLIPIVNRATIRNSDGVSEIRDVVPLVDMLNKYTLDGLVTSSFSAFPRRYVSGLFPNAVMSQTGEQSKELAQSVKEKWQNAPQSRVWLAPSPETKFGQFPESSLEGYRSMILLTLAQISAVGCIPPGFMSVLGQNPQSAEALKAQESALVARVIARQRAFSQGMEDMMRLVHQVATGTVDPALRDLQTVWKRADDASLAAEAQAAVMLYQSGLLTQEAALVALGYSPQEIATITAGAPRESQAAQGFVIS